LHHGRRVGDGGICRARGLPCAAGSSECCSSFWGAACIARRDGRYRFAGEPFDSSDVYVKGHKYRRYIFVWNIGTRWIVAAEQGGIALRSAIFVYHLGKDGKTATLINKRIGFTNNVCGAATKLAGR
jgi:hypothetical protein